MVDNGGCKIPTERGTSQTKPEIYRGRGRGRGGLNITPNQLELDDLTPMESVEDTRRFEDAKIRASPVISAMRRTTTRNLEESWIMWP